MSVFPADQHWTPCELLENNYFCFVCTKQGILIIFYVTVSSLFMFQWFQHKCFFTVCWLYLHVSEFATAACDRISASITMNSVLLKYFAKHSDAISSHNLLCNSLQITFLWNPFLFSSHAEWYLCCVYFSRILYHIF